MVNVSIFSVRTTPQPYAPTFYPPDPHWKNPPYSFVNSIRSVTSRSVQ